MVILLFSHFHQMLQFALVLFVVFFIKRWFYSFTFSLQFIFISYRIFKASDSQCFLLLYFLFAFTFGKCLLNRATSVRQTLVYITVCRRQLLSKPMMAQLTTTLIGQNIKLPSPSSHVDIWNFTTKISYHLQLSITKFNIFREIYTQKSITVLGSNTAPDVNSSLRQSLKSTTISFAHAKR